MLEAGDTPPVAFPYDERVFRRRVAGFMAVGGSLTDDYKALALPVMHQMAFSAQIAVADQLVVSGAGMPQSVVLDDRALVDAARAGRSVGSQLGPAFDDVEYRGEQGPCPCCHLSIVTLRDQSVECATCGAVGRLAIEDGTAILKFDDPAGLERSMTTLAEKRAHFREVQETAAAQRALDGEIAQGASIYERFDHRITPQAGRRAIA